MKLIRTATTFILMMMISSLSQTAQAQKCSDVCPNEDRPGCWEDSTTKRCNDGDPVGTPIYNNNPYLRSFFCYAWCNCNIFGRNCDPCGSCNKGLVDVTALDAVDDYSEYMAYSDNEKMVELSDTVCPEGKVAASYDLHKALESRADTNDDGFLSRDEFENAHHDTSDILNEHCVHINEVEESEDDVVTKALSFMGRNQDTYEEEDPVVNFVTQRAKEGENCRGGKFPNCEQPGLSCVEHRNKEYPVCLSSNKCLPSGFASGFSSGTLGHSYHLCCSKTGSKGYCR